MSSPSCTPPSPKGGELHRLIWPAACRGGRDAIHAAAHTAWDESKRTSCPTRSLPQWPAINDRIWQLRADRDAAKNTRQWSDNTHKIDAETRRVSRALWDERRAAESLKPCPEIARSQRLVAVGHQSADHSEGETR